MCSTAFSRNAVSSHLSGKRSLEEDFENVNAKRPRFYNYYKLESDSSLSSEDTESVTSLQEYETDIAQDTPDTDTKSEASSYDSDIVEIEYECDSGPDDDPICNRENEISSGTDDALTLGLVAAALLSESSVTDVEDSDDSTQSENLIVPYYKEPAEGANLRPNYKNCTLCKEKNNNRSYRYCQECFQKRKDLFPPRPRGCKKRKRRRDQKYKTVTVRKTLTPTPSSQDSAIADVNASTFNLNPSKESLKDDDLNVNTRKRSFHDEVEEDAKRFKTDDDFSKPTLTETERKRLVECNQLCIICNVESKNSIFLHGATGHMVCCYHCAVKTRNTTKRCPTCKRKIQNIIKVFMC